MDRSTVDLRSGTGMKPLPTASGDAGKPKKILPAGMAEPVPPSMSKSIPSRTAGPGGRDEE
ncbi:unnamed protein product [Dovyalis caffra]|uniref:Uncharacterized protein n=1 Tax=Dovyalis caffra TaxID=77055 RepID=A0AAV1SES6_9ROSI|nr:unnamed protein product [Dovyalis caffra]